MHASFKTDQREYKPSHLRRECELRGPYASYSRTPSLQAKRLPFLNANGTTTFVRISVKIGLSSPCSMIRANAIASWKSSRYFMQMLTASFSPPPRRKNAAAYSISADQHIKKGKLVSETHQIAVYQGEQKHSLERCRSPPFDTKVIRKKFEHNNFVPCAKQLASKVHARGELYRAQSRTANKQLDLLRRQPCIDSELWSQVAISSTIHS